MEKLIIDVSEHQGYIDWDAVKPKIDGVIIRCGYGDDDVDQDDKRWKYNVAQCEKLGIPYGVYLYSYANTDTHAKSEAAHALRLLKGHKPQYPVYIDLEEGSYGGYAVRCADIFCKAIKEAGYIPGVYTFESFYNSFMDGYDKYTLWIAKYGVNDGKPHSKPNISKPYDAWQFSSMYYMRGYSDRLDVSYFYKDFSGSSTPTPAPAPEPTPTVTIDRGKLAAAIHKDMVDDDSNGYSWDPRWGEDGKGVKTITAYGMKVSYDRGSYDCASSVITAWKAALKGTKYEHALDGATWTGNIAQVFVDSGLFVKKPISFIASPGDLYLRHDSDGDGHVAMCQTQEPDVMSEFSINEHGGVYGGQVGDQTGREAAVNPFRDEFYWVIHYNGKADSEVTPTPEPTPTPQPTPGYKKGKYKVLVNNLNVRAKASTASQSVAKYQKGQTLTADKVVTKNGYVWASYIGRSSGKRRYVAIAKADGSKKYMKHV